MQSTSTQSCSGEVDARAGGVLEVVPWSEPPPVVGAGAGLDDVVGAGAVVWPVAGAEEVVVCDCRVVAGRAWVTGVAGAAESGWVFEDAVWSWVARGCWTEPVPPGVRVVGAEWWAGRVLGVADGSGA
ncbi:hypothetical protein FSY75_29240 [Streptomyces sp. TR1341]|nr:hypothetical protein [Streptomyces sp. TR1341]